MPTAEQRKKEVITKQERKDVVMVIGSVVQTVLINELGKKKAHVVMKRIADELQALQS